MLAHMGVLYGSPPCPGWASARHLSKCYAHVVDPRKGLFLLLTEYYVGPCNCLVWQSGMSLMGQCEPIVQILHVCSGPMQGLARDFLQAAVGQFESLGNGRVFTSWANIM
jgi:hypothetical protein